MLDELAKTNLPNCRGKETPIILLKTLGYAAGVLTFNSIAHIGSDALGEIRGYCLIPCSERSRMPANQSVKDISLNFLQAFITREVLQFRR